MHRIQTTIDRLVAEQPPPPTARPGDSVAAAVDAIRGSARDCVLITDSDGGLVGIFTQRDLLNRVLAPGLDLQATAVGDVMTREPERLSRDDSCAWALARMAEGGFRNVALIDAGRAVGIVSVRDVMAHISELLAELSEPDPDESMNDWVDLGGG